MNSYRKNAIIVGVLFIIATVASSLSVVITGPLNAPDGLINISANATQLIIGALLLLIDSIAVVIIPIILFPIFKKHNEALALGYVGARIIEGAIFIVSVISLLILLTLSQEFARSGAPDVPYFQTLGTLLLAAHDWTFLLGLTVFSLGSLVLNYILFQSKLIPPWLSGWGFIGAALTLAASLIPQLGYSLSSSIDTLMNFPIALQEMVFAVWLIVKGFNSSAISSLPAKTD
ncbi:DUF4386 domain-containing protein [Chloroflexota bacterium]